jgi:hypothetical protein
MGGVFALALVLGPNTAAFKKATRSSSGVTNTWTVRLTQALATALL